MRGTQFCSVDRFRWPSQSTSSFTRAATHLGNLDTVPQPDQFVYSKNNSRSLLDRTSEASRLTEAGTQLLAHLTSGSRRRS